MTPEPMADAIRLIAELLAVKEWTNAQAISVRQRAEAWLLKAPLRW